VVTGRCFCRRALITLVTPLHRSNTTSVAASVCLYRKQKDHCSHPLWFEATLSGGGRTMMIASHPFVRCAVIDLQVKRITEYAHVLALTSAARPQQPSPDDVTEADPPPAECQTGESTRLLCSSCSGVPQRTTPRWRMTSIIISRHQSTALGCERFTVAAKK